MCLIDVDEIKVSQLEEHLDYERTKNRLNHDLVLQRQVPLATIIFFKSRAETTSFLECGFVYTSVRILRPKKRTIKVISDKDFEKNNKKEDKYRLLVNETHAQMLTS